MTLDALMKQYRGEWVDGKAIIHYKDGYIWTIATGTPDKYTLTRDGQRYVVEPTPVPTVAVEPVAEDKPKRGRRVATVLDSVDE
jgi:hypothetical protein